MEDVQNRQADVAIPIDSVGVRNLTFPITVSHRDAGKLHTVATVDLGVSLSANFKGTHMSRFVECLENWNEDLSYKSLTSLLQEVRQRLEAERAKIIFAFPFFFRKNSPSSGVSGRQSYACRLTGELGPDKKTHFLLEITVPVMTVCPCSKAISDEGAHSQRADVRMQIRLRGFTWLEEFIEMAEASASSPTYSILKREDEKFVTEHAFATPCFVEDVVRALAHKLEKKEQVSWFRVEVESYESIHAHNAFAIIERTVSPVAL